MDQSNTDERPTYSAFPVTLMHCTPANFDHPEGQPCFVVTVAKDDMTIEPLVFTMDDTKILVVKLLVMLATYEDKLAHKILDDNFTGDDDGNYVWPDQSAEL